MAGKTFGECADEYADSAHDQPWFEARHDHLADLLTAFWLGEFEDETGGCRLSIQLASNYRAASDPCTRELIFRVLPTGAPWMPAEVRYCDPSSPPYHVLARMQPRQYEPGCLLILMEKITIRDEDYHAWRRSHQKGYVRPGSRSDDKEHSLDPSREGRREERSQETRRKYKRWNDCAQEIKGEGRWTRPTEIASAIAKREKGSTERGVNTTNIKRRLDEHYPGWAERGQAQKTGAK